ncbi:MAG: FHA domain-containing protein [Nodosilinea sp. LVE1205-7]|jgi:hypothetical protein
MASLPFLGSEPAEFYGLEQAPLKPKIDSKIDYRGAALPGLVSWLPHQIPTARPSLLDSLLRNLSFDLEAVSQVIDPILTARNHCNRLGDYLQGIIVNDQCFIASNLNCRQEIQITTCGSRWLIGRGKGCKIMAPGFGVSFYHASLNFDPQTGFSLTDLASSSGTLINQQRLSPAQSHPLQEGDVVQLGSLRFEFLEELCLTDAVDYQEA